MQNANSTKAEDGAQTHLTDKHYPENFAETYENFCNHYIIQHHFYYLNIYLVLFVWKFERQSYREKDTGIFYLLVHYSNDHNDWT